MISKKDRETFEDQPEMMYSYQDVCIYGKSEVDKAKGKPRIVVTKPAKIVLKE